MWPFNRTRNFIQSLGRGQEKTPDIAKLEAGPFQLVFVCDDMKRAHKNYELIRNQGRQVGRGFTQDHFDLRIGKATGKALPLLNKEGLKVKGEIHAVSSHHIPALDNHYQNGVEFARLRVKILITDKDHRLMSIGSEAFLQHLPPGLIRTVPELGLRHYTSNKHVFMVSAHMYVALKNYWVEREITNLFPKVAPTFPAEELVWLPKYYRYPIDRNRCLK
jgi:hypothetical protein